MHECRVASFLTRSVFIEISHIPVHLCVYVLDENVSVGVASPLS